MESSLIQERRRTKGWHFYLATIFGILMTVLLVASTVYFQKEIRSAQGYGYLGVFIIGILCGVTIIPTPTLLLIFTFGHILNPLYVGLIAGFGAAIGGITVYLTGAGVVNLWNIFRPKRTSLETKPDTNGQPDSTQPKSWKIQMLYRRMIDWVSGKGGSWFVFITSALIISPFYLAGLAAGTMRLGLMRFFLLSWGGKTVRYLVVAFAGYWGLQFLSKWLGA